MWKKLFSENAAKNAVTFFHKANHTPSIRALSLLKEAHAGSSKTAAKAQASAHQHQSFAQKYDFDLDITESPPTSDQLRNIVEFVGEDKVFTVVRDAADGKDAERRLRADPASFSRPLTVDWNAGKVVIGHDESELKKLVRAAGQES